jgi:hypothetical protein
MQTPVLILTAVFSLAMVSPTHATEGEGLTAAPRWQGRVLLGTGPSSNLLGHTAEKWSGAPGALSVRSFSVLGDYYFGNRVANRAAMGEPRDALGGGFRATSGLLLGQRSGAVPMLSALSGANPARNFSVDLRSERLPLAEPTVGESNAVPYVGLGYTGMSAKGGWGFSADVGVMALNPGSAVKLGRVMGGSQNLDDVLREMRVSPTLQLGVSYSF